LVDEVVGEQPSDQDAAARDQQLDVVICLQLGDCCGEVAGRTAVDLAEIVTRFGVEKRYGPSPALKAASAIFVGSAQSLHHAVH